MENLRKWRRVALVAVLFSVIPIAFSVTEGVTANEACGASGTCATESGSVCTADGTVRYDSYWPL